MPRARQLNSSADKQALRSLFHLYQRYKRLSWEYMENPKDVPPELNAVYQLKLVPKIRELVDSLNVGPSSGRQTKLKYEPLPFTSLYNIQDDIRDSKKTPYDFQTELSKVQGGTKDLLVAHDVSDNEPIDAAQEIIAEIDRILATQDNSIVTVQLGDKPKLESDGSSWYIVGKNGKKKLCKKGSLNGELLNVLLKSWGAPRSCDAIFEEVNAATTKKGWQSECLTNAMKAINKVVSKAGYRRLKLADNGNSVIIQYTDKVN